jgi:hypothetical protein
MGGKLRVGSIVNHQSLLHNNIQLVLSDDVAKLVYRKNP